MRANLIATVQTPLAVYAATFSPGGSHVVFGGGFWYGDGFLSELDTERLDGAPRELLRPIRNRIADSVRECMRSAGAELSESAAHNLGWFSISGLAFDNTGEWLAASAWQATHRYYPAMLFRYREGGLELDRPLLDDAWKLRGSEIGPATGVTMVADNLWVRRSATSPEQHLCRFPLPGIRGDDASLASRRLASIGTSIATGMDYSSYSRGGDTIIAARASVALQRPEKTECLFAPNEANVTAITASRSGARLVTGDKLGYLTFWDSAGQELWNIGNIRAHGSAVHAACHTVAPQELLVTADSNGEVCTWNGRQRTATWSLPSGSVRTLAAHPSKPLIAIGRKDSDGGPTAGILYIYELYD